MIRALALLATAGAVLTSAAAASGPGVDESAFRYVRLLQRQGTGPAIVEPDAPLFAHAQPGLADVRVVTRQGRQIAWRPYPEPPPVERVSLRVVYHGTQSTRAVALFDAGEGPTWLDEIELDIPAGRFVGRAEVLGSDDRRTFTKLSSTVVYDIEGARAARSTTAVFPRSAVRFYLVRVSGVPEVTGATATVAGRRGMREIVRSVRRTKVAQRPRRTVVTLDLGFRRVPVDRLRIASTTRLYDRAVEIHESEDGHTWWWAASGRAFRLPGSVAQEIGVSTASRFVRVVIENGDDVPLADIAVTALADSRAILVRGGEPGPLRLLYGNRSLAPPQYDYARLPVSTLLLDTAKPATLGPERRVQASIVPPDVETFFERHGWLVPALLGLAAIGIGAAGLLAALKPRRPSGRATSS